MDPMTRHMCIPKPQENSVMAKTTASILTKFYLNDEEQVPIMDCTPGTRSAIYDFLGASRIN